MPGHAGSHGSASSCSADIVVVGGGLAGLATAELLGRSGRSVVVLEAQARVGGRILTEGAADLGAMFVGATHARLRALIARLGLGGVRPLPARGAKVVVTAAGARRTFHGTIPPLGLAPLLELQVGIIWRLDAMAAQVDPAVPGRCRHAAAWDATSVGEWARRHLWTAGARAALELSCALVFGRAAADLSLLFFLAYVRGAGGLEQLVETRGAAQDATVRGGAQAICEALRRSVQEEEGAAAAATAAATACGGGGGGASSSSVQLGMRVKSVVYGGAGEGWRVVAQDEGGGGRTVFRCRRVVMALAASAVRRTAIRFRPPLPPLRARLLQRARTGWYTKAVVGFAAPAWRQRGLCGEAMAMAPCLRFPVLATFDDCAEEEEEKEVGVAEEEKEEEEEDEEEDEEEGGGAGGGGRAAKPPHAALACFIAGDMARQLAGAGATERKAAVLRSLGRMFPGGALPAAGPLSYAEYQWAEDAWAGGGPTDGFGAGDGFAELAPPAHVTCALGAEGDAEGVLVWAGTETSPEWTGYMEGALCSAERAVAELCGGGAPCQHNSPTAHSRGGAALVLRGLCIAGLVVLLAMLCQPFVAAFSAKT